MKKNSMGYYDYRESMLTDVLKNHHFIGKDIEYLRSFFGEANAKHGDDQLFVQYNIITEFDGIEPIYSKDLLFLLDEDSIITDVSVAED